MFNRSRHYRSLSRHSCTHSRHSCEGRNPEIVLADALVCQSEWCQASSPDTWCHFTSAVKKASIAAQCPFRASANYPPLPPPASRGGRGIVSTASREGKGIASTASRRGRDNTLHVNRWGKVSLPAQHKYWERHV